MKLPAVDHFIDDSDVTTVGDLLADAEIYVDGDWIESKDQDPNGDVRLIQLADIGDGCYLDKSSRFLTSETAQRLRCTFLEPGDVLVARMPDPLGRACLFPGDVRKSITVVDVCVIRVNHQKLDSAWLVHAINSPIIRQRISEYVTGTTRQRISRGNLSKIKLSAPPLPEQRRIAAILDKADALCAKRREAIAKLDQLLQSVFLEMFGDPLLNPKGFPIRKLSEFYISSRDGTKCGPFGSALKKEELVDNGVPVWNMDNISLDGRMVLPFRMWITEHKYCDLGMYSVQDGDIIISRAGTVGKMCVAHMHDNPAIISTNLIRLRLNDHLRPLYFVSLMLYCKGRVGRLKTGADGTFTHMNTGVLDSLEFPCPPMELQNRFVMITDEVERLKRRCQEGLINIENLYGALSAQAFGSH